MAKEFFGDDYYPDTLKKRYLDFSEQLKDQISQTIIDEIGVGNVNSDQLGRLLEIIQGMASDVNSIKQLANHLFNRQPINSKYYNSTTNNWNNSLINNPIYSDDHPPIICNNESEFLKLIKILYGDIKEEDKNNPYLGGQRFIEAYNRMIKNYLNEDFYSIRSPNSLGVQRDTDPNCLFNLVKNGTFKISNIYRDGGNVNIVVQNNTCNIIPFVVHRGTVIDLPVGQQPMFIAFPFNGQLAPNGTCIIPLFWHCMYDTAHEPTSGFKLSPFIYVVPDNLDFGNKHYSTVWWDNVQPGRSGRLSETNKLWTPQTDKPYSYVIPRPNVQANSYDSWDYVPTKSGGFMTGRLFHLLDRYSNKVITRLDGVVFNNREVKDENTNNVKLISNLMGLVVRIDDADSYVLMYKDESGTWDGHLVYGNTKEREIASYSSSGDYYYIDYPSISVPSGTLIGQLINGMRADPNVYDPVFYNSQHSRHFLLGTIGASIPNVHNGQILNSNVYNLVDWSKPSKKNH